MDDYSMEKQQTTYQTKDKLYSILHGSLKQTTPSFHSK